VVAECIVTYIHDVALQMVFPETNILLNIPGAEDTHEEMLKIVSFDDRVSYHRFDVEKRLEGIGLEEWTKNTGQGAVARGCLQSQ